MKDRTALVTGAASGIGRSIGIELARSGVRVALTDLDQVGLDKVANTIRSEGGEVITLSHDVADEDRWVDVVAAAQGAFGSLTSLVNCAGIFQSGDTFSTPLDVFQKIMTVNVQGTFLGMKHAIPQIAASGGGAVVNISSICGLVGVAQSTAYCASKGAIRLMTKAVALECAQLKNKVRVNSVHPGLVDTPSFAKVAETFNSTAAEVAKTMVPIGEACSPDEVASLTRFLCSDEARHITGAEMVIDGGMTVG